MSVITDPLALGTVLSIWAHPDDEAYNSGGIMAASVDGGQRVVCVTATRGEAGFPDDDPRSVAERAAVREAELEQCLKVLGVTDHRYLTGLADGGCADVDDDGPIAQIVAILDEVKPDTVLTFSPEGDTYHPDHMAISRWTTRAVRSRALDVRPTLYYFAMTQEWVDRFLAGADPSEVLMDPTKPVPVVDPSVITVSVALDEPAAARKVQALRCQASQTTALIDAVGLDAYLEGNREETYRLATPDDWPD